MKECKKTLSKVIVFIMLVVFVSITSVPKVEAYTEAEAWKVYEITLTSEYPAGHYTDPMRDVDVTATFNAPGGGTIVRPGFWYENNTWKIRFAPTKIGNWTYTISNNVGDTGLTVSVPITITCIAASAYSPEIYKHGFPKVSSNKRYFTYDDGTPFFWLGDAHSLVTTDEEDWDSSNNPYQDWAPSNTGSMFKGMVDKRVAQGFTVYQSGFFMCGNYDPGTRYPKVNELEVYDNQSNNIALSAIVTADTSLKECPIANVNDGDTSNTVPYAFIPDQGYSDNPSGVWIPDGKYGMPQSFIMDFGTTKTIDRIELYTTEDWEIRDYQIQYYSGGNWVNLFTEVKDNTLDYIVHDQFTPVNSSKLKFIAKKGGDPYSYFLIKENVDYFKKIDQKFAYIAEKGLLNEIWMSGEFTVDRFNNYDEAKTELASEAKYYVARYGAYPVTWNVAGEEPGTYPDIFRVEIGKWVTATSTYNDPLYEPYHITQGNPGDPNDINNPKFGYYGWANAGTCSPQNPQTIEIDFEEEYRFDTIDLFTNKDYPIKSYKIQFYGADSMWHDIVDVTNNTNKYNRYSFNPCDGTKLRVICRNGPDSQPGTARINHIAIRNFSIFSPQRNRSYALWDYIAEALYDIEGDGYNRPMTVFYASSWDYYLTEEDLSNDPWPSDFEGEQWLAYTGPQSNQGLYYSAVMDSCAQKHAHYYNHFYNSNYTKKPMIEEAIGYEKQYNSMVNENTADLVRKFFWRAFQNGYAGANYGSAGIWWPIADNNDTVSDWYGHYNWYDAIMLPGPIYLMHLKNFYNSQRLPWWDLIPRFEEDFGHGSTGIVDWSQGGEDLNMPSVSADKTLDNAVLYYPASAVVGLTGTITLQQNKTYKIMWYNPRTGNWSYPISTGTTNPSGSLSIAARPDSNDWVLLLQTYNWNPPAEGDNIARRAAVSVSSTDTINFPYLYQPYHVNDGDNSCSWKSWSNGVDVRTTPQDVILDFGTTRTFDRVELYTTDGYEIKGYQLQYYDGSWHDLIPEVTNNTYEHLTYNNFGIKRGSQIKLVCKSGPDIQPGTARVCEIEVYNDNGLHEDNSIVGCWQFNEGAGTNVTDTSGNENTGTWQNGITRATGTDAKFGNAVILDGVDDYINIPDSNSLDGMGALTISSWIYMNGNPTDVNIIAGKDSQIPYGYRLTVDTNRKVHFAVDTTNKAWYGAGTYVTGSTVMSTGAWHHIVGTYDGEYVRVYVDGSLCGTGSQAISGAIDSNTSPVRLGCKVVSNTDYFNGRIDETRIYSRALNDTQVYNLYNDTPTINIALNKTMTSSTEISGYEVSKAVDGILSTNWCPSSGSFPQWIKVDLGSSCSLNLIKQTFWTGNGAIFKYKIEGSNDDLNYTTLVDRTGTGVTSQVCNEAVSGSYRYVKLTITYVSDNNWASSKEFEVYGL